MKKRRKSLLFIGGVIIVAFAIWTILVQVVDVQPIGQNGTNIGFATFNSWFHKLIGVHLKLYIITDWLGLVPIFVCVIFAGIGLTQLITRKSLFKVDYDILILGVYYLIVITCYVVFEMYPINYRPLLIEGVLEASYPSSTTLLVLSVMPTLNFEVKRRIDSILLEKIICAITNAFSAFMVVGRLFSGVHWFTDIVGSVILSVGLFCVYKAIIYLYYKEN
ncbi:MAG: phosphatase PAP2 family protein [Lachnospiraceae bacterium]|nr:phosphatase PAP2 family protein [Lachnospiraceae bacterium]